MQIKTFKPKDHKIKCLIYGASGAGKTVFTGTVEKALYASAEGGLLSIAEKNPSFVEIKSLKDLAELYTFLSDEEHEYETVVIDSITEINEIVKMEIEKRTGRVMQIQDWGELGKKILGLLRKFRDLPMHVIFVAQEQYINDEDKIKKIVPSLNGKVATGVAYFMDIVGYVHVEVDGERWIETDSNKRLLTKDRSKLIGNKAPMDFTKWQKRVKKIKTGKQKVEAEYSAPTVAPVPIKAKPKVDTKKATPKQLTEFINLCNKLAEVLKWSVKMRDVQVSALLKDRVPKDMHTDVLKKINKLLKDRIKQEEDIGELDPAKNPDEFKNDKS